MRKIYSCHLVKASTPPQTQGCRNLLNDRWTYTYKDFYDWKLVLFLCPINQGEYFARLSISPFNRSCHFSAPVLFGFHGHSGCVWLTILLNENGMSKNACCFLHCQCLWCSSLIS